MTSQLVHLVSVFSDGAYIGYTTIVLDDEHEAVGVPPLYCFTQLFGVNT